MSWQMYHAQIENIVSWNAFSIHTLPAIIAYLAQPTLTVLEHLR